MGNFNLVSEENKPREKVKMNGIQSLSDIEILALIIDTGSAKKNVLNVSMDLIVKYHSLSGVLSQSIEELSKNHAIGDVKAIKMSAVYECIKRMELSKVSKNKIKSGKDIYELLKKYSRLEQEHFIVVCLNNKANVISYDVIYKGTIDEIRIHPREILNYAIKHMSTAIIVSHNHPSGDPNPSESDIISTNKLNSAAKTIGISLLDHIILGNEDYYSLRENCDIIELE